MVFIFPFERTMIVYSFKDEKMHSLIKINNKVNSYLVKHFLS